MRSVSLKRQAENREFAKVREAVMERDNGCQLTIRHLSMGRDLRRVHRCEGPLDPHHIVPVARDTKLRLDMNNLIVLCRLAHSWVHDHPAEATELGLLKSAGLGSVPPGDPR